MYLLLLFLCVVFLNPLQVDMTPLPLILFSSFCALLSFFPSFWLLPRQHVCSGQESLYILVLKANKVIHAETVAYHSVSSCI